MRMGGMSASAMCRSRSWRIHGREPPLNIAVWCGMLIETKDGETVAARGNPDHPVITLMLPVCTSIFHLPSGC